MASNQASKRNLALLGVLVLLVLIALLAADPFGWRKPSEDQQSAKDPGRRELIALSEDEISAMEIKPVDGEAFTLSREKDEWWVVKGDKRYRANMDRIIPILDQIPGARSETLATSSAEKYEELEVSPEKAILFKVFAGSAEPKVTLLVGKAAEGYKACFVRTVDAQGESKEVYRCGVNVKQLIAFSFDDYRTMKPWNFEPELATELTLRKPPLQAPTPPAVDGKAAEPPKDANGFVLETVPAETLTFRKSGEFWQVDGKNANQNMVKDFLQKLSQLQINEYVDAPTPADTAFAADAGPSIVVKTPTGDYSLTLGPEKTSNRAVKDSAGLVYRMSTYPFNFYLTDLKWEELKFDDSAAKAAEAAATEQKKAEGEVADAAAKPEGPGPGADTGAGDAEGGAAGK